MEFGIFDHLDRGNASLGDFYRDRLTLIEAYDRAGFYCYHLAEHHATPLGMAPSPSVFLAAIAQRTRRLRFGPMVYCLPLYHPLRLAEEICMLDQMSGGRLDIGTGKGISPIEIGYYGVDPARAERMYGECWQVVLQALTRKTVDFAGEFYRIDNVPMELEPFQKPHPPLWYGVSKPDSAERAARQGLSFVLNATVESAKAIVDAYRVALPATSRVPKMGLNQFIVIAESDAAALAIARPAYRKWHANFHTLWNKHGIPPVGARYGAEFDSQAEEGRAVAGSVETVVRTLTQRVAATGVNYLVGRIAFGNIALEHALKTVELFARHVMPALRERADAAE